MTVYKRLPVLLFVTTLSDETSHEIELVGTFSYLNAR